MFIYTCVFYFAGKRKFLFFIYDVITWEKILKRFSKYYYARYTWGIHMAPARTACMGKGASSFQSECVLCHSILLLSGYVTKRRTVSSISRLRARWTGGKAPFVSFVDSRE